MAFAVPGIYLCNSLPVIGSSFVTRLPEKKIRAAYTFSENAVTYQIFGKVIEN
jgi:hypothetical protein